MRHERPADDSRRLFEELDALRLTVEERLAGATNSLTCYADEVSGGFFHQMTRRGPGDPSKASTATCASFLVASGRWGEKRRHWNGKADRLARVLADEPWESAGLGIGNPFTVSFLLEALHDLQEARAQEQKAPTEIAAAAASPTANEVVHDSDSPDDQEPPTEAAPESESSSPPSSPDDQPPPAGSAIELQVQYWSRYLCNQLLASDGGLYIEDFPATCFLTYKAVRVLELWGELSDSAKETARAFAWARLYEESVAVSAGAGGADVFELAYAAMTVSRTTTLLEMTPRQRDVLRYAVDQFFAAQGESGEWPRSRALFRYPKLGNAYCYDYELLTQMLSDRQFVSLLEDKRLQLTRAFSALERSAIPIGEQGETGWASGHLPNSTAPESWTTASAYHFCHEFRRFVVDAIRREVFAYARAFLPATGLDSQSGSARIDPDAFLDCDIDDNTRLRTLLEVAFLEPVLADADRVRRGHGLKSDVPNSAILYGPPGTSKTQLAEIIARALGWPLLKLDPSHLTRDGLDRLHAETNLLFTMLASAERMVVLLDEFDELVQDRDQSGAESSSRFLTTAMLPKIAELAKRRRIVYLLATNHIERFDDAISRAGRFDLVIPVMPPRLDEKLRRWDNVRNAIDKFYSPDGLDHDLQDILGDLTFLEFQQFANRVPSLRSRNEFSTAIKDAGATATLQRTSIGPEGGDSRTWKERVQAEAGRNRLRHP